MTFATNEREILHHQLQHLHPIRAQNLQVKMKLARRTKERSQPQGAKEKLGPEGHDVVAEPTALPRENNPEKLPVTMIVTKMNFRQGVRKDIQIYHLILLSWHVCGLDQSPDLPSEVLAMLMNLTKM